MSTRFSLAVLTAFACVLVAAPAFADDRNPHSWEIHDGERPQPPKVDPGPYTGPLTPPGDAIVLFDGTNFDHWRGNDGDAAWRIIEDEKAMQVVPESGDIQTRESFSDVQLYVEFKTDPDSPGSGQSRSNSGVFFGPYEVQVLDTYDNPTYADGIAGSIYGQYPPLVNASRPAGEWQSFNIIYRAPSFDEDGAIEEPARITVFHNNILVQDSEPLVGPTSHGERTDYFPHGDLHIRLQDHRDDPIHFRNIWVRELN
ncbi:MAG: DUF1080 domain-containing protein [Phycisphaeraceae bacterium]